MAHAIGQNIKPTHPAQYIRGCSRPDSHFRRTTTERGCMSAFEIEDCTLSQKARLKSFL